MAGIPDRPPHVHDDTPIALPPAIVRANIVSQLRQFADQFRGLNRTPGDITTEPYHATAYRVQDGALVAYPVTTRRVHHGRSVSYPDDLFARCGNLLIQAHAAGLIPCDPPELADLIEWHAGENRPLPDGVQAKEMRCASNLFRDVCGGNTVSGEHFGEDARGRVILKNEKIGGGLMPRFNEHHLGHPPADQYALTCGLLADLIEHLETAKAKNPGGRKPGRFATLIVPRIEELLRTPDKHGQKMKWLTIKTRIKQEFGHEYRDLARQYNKHKKKQEEKQKQTGKTKSKPARRTPH